jgi:hypothetical protein
MEQTTQIESNCHTCGLRSRAEKKPDSLVSHIWRWHTGWCPGWKAYIQELESKGLAIPKI